MSVANGITPSAELLKDPRPSEDLLDTSAPSKPGDMLYGTVARPGSLSRGDDFKLKSGMIEFRETGKDVADENESEGDMVFVEAKGWAKIKEWQVTSTTPRM